MFRHSGPGHMLLHTVHKQKVKRPNFTFTYKSESEIRRKQKFTKILLWKKIDPLRSNPAPSPTVPLLHCPQAPPCRDFLLLCRHLTLPNNQGRASTAHVGAPGSTPGLEGGVGRHRSEDPPWCWRRCRRRWQFWRWQPPPSTGWLVWCAILTPSFAFLLWALEKIPVSSIRKCSNISTSILPSCFSLMCFQRGLSANFFLTSATYSSPLL